uniref:IDL3 n=1 Tax=Rosa x burboniana TaxID=358216 RepID=A0A890CAS5_9ROSA|nr:IDL3 [Rosa x burboniana]
MSSSPKRLLVGFAIFVLLLLGMASVGSCSRPLKNLKEMEIKSLMEAKLPRGPVPPSGPSRCHNKLSPTKNTQLFTQDYVICP